MKNIKLDISIFCYLLLIFLGIQARASKNDLCDQSSPIPLFQGNNLIEMNLASSIFNDEIQQNAEDKGKKIGTLNYFSNSFETSLDVELEIRGRSRAALCNFKPLKMYLKSNFENSLFGMGDDDIKIVTHCLDSNNPIKMDRVNQRVLAEYQLYKTIELTGAPALKTRLIHFNYFDSFNNFKTKAYGFFIESKKDLAKRCHSKLIKEFSTVKGNGYSTEQVVSSQFLPYFLSQLLVINGDYSLSGLKNTIALINEENREIAVPYDFDMSGLVRSKDNGVTDYEWKDWNIEDIYDEGFFQDMENSGYVWGIDKKWRHSNWSRIIIDSDLLTWKGEIRAELLNLYNGKDRLYHSVNESLLDDTHRNKIIGRFDVFFQTIEKRYHLNNISNDQKKKKTKRGKTH